MVVEDAVDRMVREWAERDPDLDVEPLQVVGRILVSAKEIERILTEVVEPLGLSYADFDMLNTLRRLGDQEGTHPGDLSRSLLITSGAITARLDRLVRAGLVVRRADPVDRRAVRIRLTAKGERLAKRALDAVLAADEAILVPFSARQRAGLASSLRRLASHLEQDER